MRAYDLIDLEYLCSYTAKYFNLQILKVVGNEFISASTIRWMRENVNCRRYLTQDASDSRATCTKARLSWPNYACRSATLAVVESRPSDMSISLCYYLSVVLNAN